jgi:S1-C subfamily serine protease
MLSGENRALRTGPVPGSVPPAPQPVAQAPDDSGAAKGPAPLLIGLIAGGIAVLVLVVGVGIIAAVVMSRSGPQVAAVDESESGGPRTPSRPPRVVRRPPISPKAPENFPRPPGKPFTKPTVRKALANNTPPSPPAPPARDDAAAVLGATAPGAGGTTPAPAPTVVNSSAPGGGTHPPDLVQQVKDATVFIKVRAGAAQASGSGFVMRVDGQTVYIATNHHVVNPHLEGSEEEAGPQATRMRPQVTVVFRSGQGRALEHSYRADVVASQREGNRDLAILKVERVDRPPLPIVLDSKIELTETMPVLIYGFPFGNIEKLLNSGAQGNPAMTINRGSVSSLRKDDSGHINYIQIDGSINPGNSGGPVVDEKGRLVGISVAAISNTTIGFAIPPAELIGMLDGRTGRLLIALTGLQQGTANLQVQTRLIDPLGKLKAVELLYVRDASGSAMPRPNPDGTWPPLANANRVGLSMNGLFASAPLQTTQNAPSGRKMLVQVSYQDREGKTVYMSPITYEIPTRPTNLSSIGAPAPTRPGAPKGETVAVLGEMVDPSKKCKMTRTGNSLTFEVPAGLYLLNDELDVKNAPIVKTAVEGDFAAVVKVDGNMVPGTEPAKYKNKPLPFTFQGAGLLLWQDRNNYVRLERVVQTTKRTKVVLTSEVMVEICKNGKSAGRFVMNVPEGPVFLLLGREKGGVKCLFSMDGRRWVALKTLAVAFPDKVEIGLEAGNASREALVARFENFNLFRGTADEKVAEGQ